MRFFSKHDRTTVDGPSRIPSSRRRAARASTPRLEGLERRDLKTVSISYDPVSRTAAILGSQFNDTVKVVLDKHGTASVWDDQYKLTITNTQGESAALTIDAIALRSKPGSNGKLVFYTVDALAQVNASLYEGNDAYENTFACASFVNGGGGNDTITTGTGNDTVYGGAGDDVVGVGAGRDVVYGDLPAASLIADGNDTIRGGNGDDSLYGCGGDDAIEGGAGKDVIEGNDGSDWIYGDDPNDFLGGDNDTIDGGAGVDTVFGQGGNDYIRGGSENDFLMGGEGDDVMHGDGGDDYLEGNAGSDWIYGDAGYDEGFGDDWFNASYWHNDEEPDHVVDTEKFHW